MKTLHNDLTMAFIMKEYPLHEPVFTSDDYKDRAIEAYQNNSLFHAKVETIVHYILDVIEQNKTGLLEHWGVPDTIKEEKG